jgi:hypothetical protein
MRAKALLNLAKMTEEKKGTKTFQILRLFDNIIRDSFYKSHCNNNNNKKNHSDFL